MLNTAVKQVLLDSGIKVELLRLGLGDGLGFGEGLGEGDGETDLLGDGLGFTEALGLGEGEGLTETDGEGLGPIGTGLGVGIGVVRTLQPQKPMSPRVNANLKFLSMMSPNFLPRCIATPGTTPGSSKNFVRSFKRPMQNKSLGIL